MNPSNYDNAKATIRRLYEEIINSGDLAALQEVIAPEYTGPNGEPGPAGFASTVTGLRAAFPDIRFTIEDLLADRDRVVVRWTWQGTHRGPFAGVAPTLRSVNNSGIAIYTLRGSRVISSVLQADRLGVLQQLGVVPAGVGQGGPARRP